MSYEYKDDINMMIFANPGKDLMKSFKMRDEIDHVYAQAAKAGEYEAKEKAFNAISYIIKKRAKDDFYSVNNDYEAGILRAYEVMECNVDDFYRGDTDD